MVAAKTKTGLYRIKVKAAGNSSYEPLTKRLAVMMRVK